jgi:hypothetical protein
MSWVDTYVSFCFFVAMAAPVVFVVVYSTMPWKTTWEGRVLMFKQALWVGFLLNGVLYFALGDDYFGRDALRIVLFTALPVALWGLTVLLIVRRHQGQVDQTAPPTSEESHPLTDDHQLG